MTPTITTRVLRYPFPSRGASVAANKVDVVRSGLCHDDYSARQGVEDDDMNVLCLGGRTMVSRWLGLYEELPQGQVQRRRPTSLAGWRNSLNSTAAQLPARMIVSSSRLLSLSEGDEDDVA